MATLTRPLNVLAPMIGRELQAGTGHYRAAGVLLREAKEQLGHGQWRPWLKQHFELSERTARAYMLLANRQRVADFKTVREAAGTARRVAADAELARELITAGHRALALRYHPDRPGGSVSTMAAVNAVRHKLFTSIARWRTDP